METEICLHRVFCREFNLVQHSFEAIFNSHKSIDTIDILFESIDAKFFRYLNTASVYKTGAKSRIAQIYAESRARAHTNYEVGAGETFY